MLREGVGMTAPAPIPIRLGQGEIRWLSEVARKRDAFRGYAHRSDAWGRGFIRNPGFVGLCGEHALCRYLNPRCGLELSVDTTLRTKGDRGCDLKIAGMVIQVKTRAVGQFNLVRRVTGSKRLLPLSCDVFVFACLNLPVIRLTGWITSSAAPLVALHIPSSVADHFNLRIYDTDLAPMSRLVEEIKDRRKA